MTDHFGENDDSFGFDVKAAVKTSQPHRYGTETHQPGDTLWSVELPHQCGEWSVAFSNDRGVAVAELERFISEAQAALTRLRGMPEPSP